MFTDRLSSQSCHGVEAANARLSTPASEKFVTIKQAAEILGLKYFQLQRAVSDGLIPSYRPFGPRRRYVRLTEVVAFISAHRVGGDR